MLQSNAKHRQFEPGYDIGGGAHHATFTSRRVDPLALPRVDPAVATLMDTPFDAQMALYWLDAGYLDESMHNLPARQLAQAGFQRWASKQLGELADEIDLTLGYSGEPDRSRPKGEWSVSVELDTPSCRLMEPRFNTIEAKTPGLYQTALSVLETALWRANCCGTPAGVHSRVAYMLWFGIDDQESLIDELIGMGAEPEDLEGRLMPDDFKKSIPDWVLNAKSTLSKSRLKQLAKTGDDEVVQIAALVLTLQKLEGTIREKVVEEAESVYPLALMRWNSEDQVLRGFDDAIEDANNCCDNYTSWIAAETIEPGAEAFKAWLDDYSLYLQAIGAAYRLIKLLSDPYNE